MEHHRLNRRVVEKERHDGDLGINCVIGRVCAKSDPDCDFAYSINVWCERKRVGQFHI